MKARIVIATAAMVLFPLVGLTGQTTHDIAQYFMLNPGQWKITESNSLPPGPVFTQEGMVVTQLGQYVVHNWFKYDGSKWTFRRHEVIEVTSTHLIYHGEINSRNEPKLFDPPLRIPRALKLNEAVMQSGVARSNTGAVPYVFTFVVTADKVMRKVRAGTFTDCITWRSSTIMKDRSETSSDTSAKNVGPIFSAYAELDESNPMQPVANGGKKEATSISP